MIRWSWKKRRTFPPLAIDISDLDVRCECGGEMLGRDVVMCLDCNNEVDEEDVWAFASACGAFVGCRVGVKRHDGVLVSSGDSEVELERLRARMAEEDA